MSEYAWHDVQPHVTYSARMWNLPSRRRFGPEFLPLNVSAPFIRRPVATTLITIALALAGTAAFGLLPVA
ncbi:MAG: hypothetical protein LBR94_06575, partial [Desulfovibrio sp.]|nr:hypothetical protein [Desulfovibrio sp.]